MGVTFTLVIILLGRQSCLIGLQPDKLIDWRKMSVKIKTGVKRALTYEQLTGADRVLTYEEAAEAVKAVHIVYQLLFCKIMTPDQKKYEESTYKALITAMAELDDPNSPKGYKSPVEAMQRSYLNEFGEFSRAYDVRVVAPPPEQEA